MSEPMTPERPTDNSALVARLRANDSFNYIDLRNEAANAIVVLETRVKQLEQDLVWAKAKTSAKTTDKVANRILKRAANAHGEAGK